MWILARPAKVWNENEMKSDEKSASRKTIVWYCTIYNENDWQIVNAKKHVFKLYIYLSVFIQLDKAHTKIKHITNILPKLNYKWKTNEKNI